MSGQSTGDQWLENFMNTASPEKKELMKNCLRDENFFLVSGIDELMAALKQIEDKKRTQ